MRLFRSPAFQAGFRAVLPLWLAAAPFAVTYAIAARKAGLNPLEVQIMSLTVYNGAAQMAMVQSTGTSLLSMLVTVVLVNLHHLIYGMTLTERTSFSRLERAASAYLLTDGAFGVTIAAGSGASFPFLLGAELSMFLVWNLFTAFGLAVGQAIAFPAALHLDFVIPLTFSALLVSMLKTRADLVAAASAAMICTLGLVLQLGAISLIVAALAGPCMVHLLNVNRASPDIANEPDEPC